MTEAQARAFMAQVEQEFPDQVLTRLGHGRNNQAGTSFIVTLQYKDRILSVYQTSDWQPIKWAWGLENAEITEKRQWYLVDDIPMTFHKHRSYWYGHYEKDGQRHKKYFGRVDPRPLYPLVEKEEVTI